MIQIILNRQPKNPVVTSRWSSELNRQVLVALHEDEQVCKIRFWRASLLCSTRCVDHSRDWGVSSQVVERKILEKLGQVSRRGAWIGRLEEEAPFRWGADVSKELRITKSPGLEGRSKREIDERTA